MSYIINKTDGSVLTEIVDGTVDQTATDLTLVGKNASSYGESRKFCSFTRKFCQH